MTVPISRIEPARATPVAEHQWTRRERPLRLERQLRFADYGRLRDFLDRAGAVSEQTGIFPNLSFGRDYVNLTLFADDDSGSLAPASERFARHIDGLAVADPEAGGAVQ
jgi:pterin-4a-carbinolamine dehydratase